MPYRDIVVIGASLGGLDSLVEIISRLPADFGATVFIVRHISAEANVKELKQVLAKDASLPVRVAGHCKSFQKNSIYLAPARYHLLINESQTYLSSGPRENLARPAVDPLFRSAAVAFGARVTGIILSGELDDGTAGLITVKENGGLAIVQDPQTALASSMPESAMEHAPVDHVLAPGAIGEHLGRLVTEKVVEQPQEVQQTRNELKVLTGSRDSVELMDRQGDLIPVGCPSCGGPLWQQHGRFKKFRCHTGHAFSEKSMNQGLENAQEKALYTALRTLEERVRMLTRLNKNSRTNLYGNRLEEARQHADELRRMLHTTGEDTFECT